MKPYNERINKLKYSEKLECYITNGKAFISFESAVKELKKKLIADIREMFKEVRL